MFFHRVKKLPADYTKGVFQTLGFKEFHEYLMLTSERRATEEGAKLLRAAIENMKMATRRYARRQNKMILARFLNHPTRETACSANGSGCCHRTSDNDR
ncbi:tRNA dimethylallyltransferase [Eumeta japonica]|uniref:tRNA dimethylallyltransferase n=1 Tax=Eumeta variegata TaxID=151549 RepID=A0A4C1TZ78_EUMVA|nr:tRNA dimethylallyltransferase [Eumeta japonica]